MEKPVSENFCSFFLKSAAALRRVKKGAPWPPRIGSRTNLSRDTMTARLMLIVVLLAMRCRPALAAEAGGLVEVTEICQRAWMYPVWESDASPWFEPQCFRDAGAEYPVGAVDEALSLPLPIPPTASPPPPRALGPWFERNDGQTDARVRFLSRGPGYHLYLSPSDAVFVLFRRLHAQSNKHSPPQMEARSDTVAVQRRAVRMRLLSANPGAEMRAAEPLPGKVNYFIGDDPARWHAAIPTFGRVLIDEVYPGIALAYYGHAGRLEFDFQVAPGADPNRIALQWEGAEKVDLTETGDLRVTVAGWQLICRKPLVYQGDQSDRREIAGSYALDSSPSAVDPGGSPTVRFQIGSFDATQPVVIDPVLVYSTFLGGVADDIAYAVAADAQDSAYVTGSTFSLDFPTTTGVLQPSAAGEEAAFVTRLSPDGTQLIYSTYLGGSGVGVINEGHAIAVDPAGNAIVTGPTRSTDFPVLNPLQANLGGLTDAFISKLTPDGTALLFSTYFGGEGSDTPWAIALDAATNIYLTGQARSVAFPGTGPGSPQATNAGNGDAFVTKIDGQGTRIIYSTFLGGTASDIPHGLAVDNLGRAYIAGNTTSTNFPTRNAIFPSFGGGVDGFVARLSATGSEVEYATYMGGNLSLTGIAADTSGSAFVTGLTSSTNLPITPQAFQRSLAGAVDLFIAKLNPAGSAFDYLTYLGGNNIDLPAGIVVDGGGNAYVAGRTSSTNFPTLNPLQAQYDPSSDNDAFLSKINPDGSALVWSTYFGATRDVLGLTRDSTGGIYFVGRTGSATFPTKNAVQPNYAGLNNDAFIVKVSDPLGPLMRITRVGASVTLSWPTAATGFKLETSDRLAPAPNWVQESAMPSIVGDQTVVTVQASGQTRFWRLRSE
jgi:hypothetical protein